MNSSNPTSRQALSRTFFACLNIALLILGPLAPLSLASASSLSLTKIGTAPAQPAAPLVPNISATKVDSFPDADMDGKAAPGETITYDVNITNSGTDANDVNFSDTVDVNTTLVGGSLKVSPLAYADTYAAAQNTPLSVGAPGVLGNDTGIPSPTAVAIVGGATAQGGTVTLNPDGSFMYTPASGFTGVDTFNYSVTNGLTPDDTALVTINVDAPPSVTITTPSDGATNQALNTDISITFSEPVNVTGNWFQISCTTSGTRNVADTVVTGGPTTFTINPNVDFSQSETCTVTVFAAQVSDQDAIDPPDNMAANVVFSFSTQDAAPTVTNTTPANGATDQTTNTNIAVTFSEPVNVTGNWFQIVCTSSGTRNVADTIVTGGPTTFTINPNADFSPGESCTVTVFAAQVTDQDANDPPDNMAANFVFSFSTDNTPTVNATTPTNGATQVANNSNISITFSEPVNVTGNWFQIVGATSGTQNVADAVVTGGPTTFSINPNGNFTNGEVVTVTVFASQVTDQDTNDPPDNMAANFVFSFTIDQPPAVTTTVPVNGAINVAKSANIVVNFNENVTATTSSFTIECPAPGNLRAFTLSGSGTNQITLDPTVDLPQGVICTVTVIANQISDTDTGDPPDNMVSNFVFSFGVQPEAIDDAHAATGNIRLQTAGNSNFTVLANDIGPGISVTASDTTSLRGGNVSVAANGTFTYNPPAGYDGVDSFNYTISNAAGSDVGTVVITITGMLWFVNNTASACTTINGSCGRLTNPFSTLAAFEAANGNATPIVNGNVTSPVAGDHLFIYTGVGNYTGPVTLENNQRVIGQGATSSLQALSGITPATDSDAFPTTGGAKPSITTPVTSGLNGFNLASGDQLHGLAFSNTDGAAIRGAVNVGTLLMSDLAINNTGGGGIILTNGGTVTISGTNTIVTTTATALNLTNTTISATGLTFQSISSSGGSNTGIILDTTGSSGGLTVNGDGGNTAVGGNSSGGTIGNKSGANGATTTGNAIYLNSTSNVVLRRMTINGTNQNHGIRGVSVTGFTLEFSTVTGTNGTSAALDEGSINFDNLLGSAAITSCVIDGGFEDNLNVVNTSGTLNRLTISGSTFGFNNTTNGNNNILLSSNNAGTTMNVTLKSSLIKGARADWVSAVANSGSTMDLVVGGPLVADGNNFDNLGANAHPGAAAGGNRMVATSVGTQTVDIRNNTMKGSKGDAIFVRSTIVGATRGNSNARVRNNTVGVIGTANSGSSESSGIFVNGDGGGNMTAAVTDNSVFQYNNHGIRTDFGDEILDGAVYNITVTGNTVSNPGNINTNFNGYHLNNGTVGVTDNFTTCLNLSGNTLTGSGAGAISPNNQEFRLRQRQSTTVRLPGYGGNNNNDAQVVNLIRGQNTVSPGNGAASNTVPTGGGFVGGAACTAPSFALVMPESTNGKDHFARAKEKRGLNNDEKRKEDKSAAVVSRDGEKRPTVLSHHTRITMKRAGFNTSNAIASRKTIPTLNNITSRPQVNTHQDKTKGGIKVKPRVDISLAGGETVTHSVGTLLAGKTVHIQFQVTVNSPYAGGATVANQGVVSGSNFADVVTDDPAVGGASDPTITQIQQIPNVSVADAQANEPASGSTPMIFSVALTSPAPAGGASVHYQTADQAPGAGHAVAGVDYTAIPDTVLNFAAGEQFKTITVNILADLDAGEPDETFLLNLSNPTNAIIVDGQAVGTIKQGNAAGTFLISELRTSGPAGAGDDFVELYNNSDMPLTVTASDASGGYGLFKMGADCSTTPVLIGTIPNGTVIPARGHYLFAGSAYSLANYGGTGAAAGDQTLSADIESDRNVGIFNTSSVANLSSVTRLDAVGFGSNTGGVCDLLREGTTLPPLSGSTLEHSYVRDECGKKGNPAIFGPCPTGGLPADTNVNSDDFVFVDTQATMTPAGQRLGAPGPQNSAGPLVRTAVFPGLLIDSNLGAPSPPNRVRDLTPTPPNATNGTLSIRRRFVNNTGAPVTRLRFRIVDISSIPVPGGIADLRALTSTNVSVSGITDGATCLASSGSATTPCIITVFGTTLETPPAQPMGGAHNSSLSAGTITLGTPLAPGASINLQFLMGVQQTGSFKFYLNIEALP